MAVMPSPEEMQMMETQRRLRKLGYSEDIIPTMRRCAMTGQPISNDMDKLIALCEADYVKQLPAPKKVKDERKDTKAKETPFPGEFTVMRIPG